MKAWCHWALFSVMYRQRTLQQKIWSYINMQRRSHMCYYELTPSGKEMGYKWVSLLCVQCTCCGMSKDASWHLKWSNTNHELSYACQKVSWLISQKKVMHIGSIFGHSKDIAYSSLMLPRCHEEIVRLIFRQYFWLESPNFNIQYKVMACTSLMVYTQWTQTQRKVTADKPWGEAAI